MWQVARCGAGPAAEDSVLNAGKRRGAPAPENGFAAREAAPAAAETRLRAEVATLRRRVAELETLLQGSGVQRLEEAKDFSEAIVETLPLPLLVLTEGHRVVAANRAFHDRFGGRADETLGREVFALGDGRWDSPGLRSALAALAQGAEAVDDLEVRHELPEGILSLRLHARPLGGTRLVLLAIEDISEHRRAEAHLRMLMAELNHRVKNTLAVVNAIAFQTLRRSASMQDFTAAFEGRMQSLARTHSALAETGWEPTDLGVLVDAWLEPYGLREPSGPIRVSGTPVRTTPQQSVALGMALHELATNAGKYGALSRPGGRVRVEWRTEPRGDEGGRRPPQDRQVRLTWSESGGPPVAPPQHRGFGIRFVEEICAYDLGGEARVDFAPDGLRFELVFPVARGR